MAAERILVTGGSGFIGTNLVEAVRRDGEEVASLDVKPPRHPDHGPLWQRCDILDESELRSCIEHFQPTLLFHLAARTDLDGRSEADYPQNVQGVANVLSVLSGQAQLTRALFASSRLVCEIGYVPQDDQDYRPSTAYGASKVAGERVVRAALEVPWTIVRPTSIWGPWFGVPYRDFFDSVRSGRYMHPRDRAIHKSFGFVGNTVAQLRALARSPSALGRTLYLADYEPIEVGAFADLIRRESSQGSVRQVPIQLLRVAARLGDLAGAAGWQHPPLTSFRLNNLLTDMVFDLGELRRAAGEIPYDLESGVRLTIDWLEDQRAAFASRASR